MLHAPFIFLRAARRMCPHHLTRVLLGGLEGAADVPSGGELYFVDEGAVWCVIFIPFPTRVISSKIHTQSHTALFPPGLKATPSQLEPLFCLSVCLTA